MNCECVHTSPFSNVSLRVDACDPDINSGFDCPLQIKESTDDKVEFDSLGKSCDISFGELSGDSDQGSSIRNHVLESGSSNYCDRIVYYDDSNVIPLCPIATRLMPRHDIGGNESQMNIHAWKYYLGFEDNETKRLFLEKGITCGFEIVDPVDIAPYACTNYSSVCSGPAYEYINNLILQEIKEGKYVRADFTPKCIHALGAIQKDSSSFRPITDCLRPLGLSINNYMDSTCSEFSYKSVDLVASYMTKGCFMATIDNFSAYRSISVIPDQWTYQGIWWEFEDDCTYLLDSRLCFG